MIVYALQMGAGFSKKKIRTPLISDQELPNDVISSKYAFLPDVGVQPSVYDA